MQIDDSNRKMGMQNTLLLRLFSLCSILFCAIMLVNGCTFLPNTDTVTSLSVIVIGPFSGDISDLGQSMRNGIVLATEEQNAKGGVLGRQIQLSLYDSECDYTTARDVTQQAIRETGANYILGAVCSEASEGVAQIASDEGVLVLNPASVREDLTFDNDGVVRPLVFRIPFTDPTQGMAAAVAARDQLDAETASILVADSALYEITLADAFEDAFTTAGGEVLLRESYERSTETYYDVLSELREVNADIVYIPGYAEVINKLVDQARLYGINQIMLGSDGWHSPDLNVTLLDGAYFTTQYAGDIPKAVVRDWIDRYENQYLVEPDTVATLSYDSANLLFSAIENTGTTAPYELAASMEEMVFESLLGEISFDSQHNPIKSIILLRVQNNSVMYDSRVNINDLSE